MPSTPEDMHRLLSNARFGGAPSPTSWTFGDRLFTPSEVVATLEPYLTDARRAGIEEVLDGRSYAVATVVEGLVNAGNVSAVMRSAEALGCQPFHLVTGAEEFKGSSRSSQGAEKWLDLYEWPDGVSCARHLKAEGYQIVATHLDETAVPIDTIDFTRRTALVFGNEAGGVSAEMLALSDRRCIIPTTGFVQSLNISVAAALALYHAVQDRVARTGCHGDLTPEQRERLRAAFYLRSVRQAEAHLRRAACSSR